MTGQFEYQFWFGSEKLLGVMTLLSTLVEYDLADDEFEIIRQELRLTNDELNQWSSHTFKGKNYLLSFKLAFDAEEKADMIHINISTSKELADKIQMVDLFQSLFRQLDPEK